jgi:hypothetical protein
MIIRKKPPRSHKLHEPIRHDGSHPRPVSRRDFLATGFLASQATLIGSSAMLGAFFNPRSVFASTTTLANDISSLQTACGIVTDGAGKIPFIVFDLAGGANLNGSEALIGGPGGQLDFLTTAGYGKLGLPGDMLPNSPNTAGGGNFIDTSLGLAWHSDGAILRGIKSMASAQAMANTNGAVIAAMSQNDTQQNPHNPMYGIYDAGANGALLTLIGTMPTVSGGNSAAPSALINLTVSPTVVTQSSDITGLVNTGQLGTIFSNPADAVSVLESTIRLSGGNVVDTYGGKLGAVTAMLNDPTTDAALKQAARCSYVKSTVLVNQFGDPASLNPDKDTNIVGASNSIFTAAQYQDNDFIMTAAVMKMVVNGLAGAGTISLSGFDYHDGTRATGETRNFQAGQAIGACLEYAKRVGVPLMIYVISDGSLSSTGMIDTSAAGRGKFGWQGDNQSTAATLFLVYNPAGRPVVNPSATTPNQIGSYTYDGSVNTTSSPAANAVNLLVNTVILNYMALHGQQANFNTTIPDNGLGTALDPLIAFNPIVNGVIS